MKREIIEVEFSVLENGFDFIHKATKQLVDLQSNGTNVDVDNLKQALKYAVLNLSSGIELIFKHCLFDSHWTYVFQDMNKSDKESLNKGHFISVNSETAILRLEKFCEIELTQKNKDTYKKLREYRNKLEHFNCKMHVGAVENLLHNNISLIAKFVSEHAIKSGYTEKEKIMLQRIKDALLLLDDYYEEVKNLAASEAKHYIEGTLGITYHDIQNGEGYPLCECPECDNKTLVVDSEKGIGICFYCESEYSASDFNNCGICGKLFYNHGEWGAMCDECSEEKMRRE